MGLAFISCGNNEELTPKPIQMLERAKLNYGQRLLSYNEKINSVAYNNKTQSILFSLEPTPGGQTSVFEFNYKSTDNLSGIEFSNNFKLKAHATKPNKIIKISPNGKFLAFSSWNGELIIKTKDSIYSKTTFDYVITSLEFIDKFIVIGDRKGNITLYDIEKKKIHTSIKLFNGNVTSIKSFKLAQFFVSGTGSNVYLVDGESGKILRTIKTRNFKEKLLIFSGLNHCIVDRINEILYIPEKETLVTTHGWDYCSRPKIKVWNVNTWKTIFETKILEAQVNLMTWAPKTQEIIFADENTSLWTLNLDNQKLENKTQLSGIFDLLNKPNEKKQITLIKSFKFGMLNSLELIPNTDIAILGVGSFFRGGSGLLITRKTRTNFKHLGFFGKSKNHIYLFTPREIIPQQINN